MKCEMRCDIMEDEREYTCYILYRNKLNAILSSKYYRAVH
jgi:hypothetical protein